LQASGVIGSNNTYGDELTQSGISGKFSYSLAQFHYQTDGFRENNGLTQDIYNVFAQGSLSPTFSVQAEYRHRELEHGDLNFNFDLDEFEPISEETYVPIRLASVFTMRLRRARTLSLQ
jgi:hypothetical protein